MMKPCHPQLKAAGLMAMRLAIGVIFIYAGYNKLFTYHEMAAGMMDAKVGLPGGGSLWAYVVGGLELLGGVMLILGVWARYAASWLAFIMVVALLTVHRGQGLDMLGFPLALLGACLGFVGTGAGKWRLVKAQCHCKGCREAGSGCGGACGGNGGCGDKKEAKPDGCCGGSCCSSGLEEKK